MFKPGGQALFLKILFLAGQYSSDTLQAITDDAAAQTMGNKNIIVPPQMVDSGLVRDGTMPFPPLSGRSFQSFNIQQNDCANDACIGSLLFPL